MGIGTESQNGSNFLNGLIEDFKKSPIIIIISLISLWFLVFKKK